MKQTSVWIKTLSQQIFIFIRKMIDARIVGEDQTQIGLRYYPIEIQGFKLGANIARKAAIEYDEFVTNKEVGSNCQFGCRLSSNRKKRSSI